MEMVPSFTCLSVLSYRPFQLSGAMNMSMPALNAAAQLSLVQPATWP